MTRRESRTEIQAALIGAAALIIAAAIGLIGIIIQSNKDDDVTPPPAVITATPPPTNTPAPTDTGMVSFTPVFHTATYTPTATSTDTPTATYTPTSTPTVTQTRVYAPTETSTATSEPLVPMRVSITPATKAYPCTATVIFYESGLLNVVRAGPSRYASPRDPIAQGAAIIIWDKKAETRTDFWYLIAKPDGEELGWIPVRYVVLSDWCPE